MLYFQELPKLLYSTSLEVPNFKLVPNLLARVAFLDKVLQNSTLYYQYDVKDGERPEDIANRLYGDPNRHWIILMANKITDPQYDWVLGQNDFNDFINKKYSSYTITLDRPSALTLGEEVFQGPSYDAAESVANVVSQTGNTATINFLDETFSTNVTINGVTSGNSYNVLSIQCNDNGYEWASNTTAYYQVTETRINSFDNTPNTVSYKVTNKIYNFSTGSIVDNNIQTSWVDVYNLNDGTTLTISTVVAPVSFYDFEVNENEAKRKIIVPKSDIVNKLETEFSALMKRV